MQSSIRIDRNVPMETRDGTVLRADIYRPNDRQKHPAILMRTPYNKLQRVRSDTLSVVDAGYALVIQDIRGRYASEGEWRREDMFIVEGPDGYDSVEWMASQRWCDGNVGMMGESYLGTLQWVAAMESPPHLKAVAPAMSTVYTVGMIPPPSGGAVLLSLIADMTVSTAVDVVNRLEREGQDVTEMRRTIDWAQSNPEEAINFLPLKDIPFARFERIRQMWNLRLHQPSTPKSEQERRERYEKVMVPCFHTVGWYDTIRWAVFESFKNMRKRGGSQLAREGQYLLLGPWPHAQLPSTLGAINFSTSAGEPAAQAAEQHIAFFDRYLRGKDINIPTVRYFVMGRNQWQNSDDWPPPQTEWQRFYLHSKGSANTAAGDGLLDRDEPGSEPPDRFVYDPHHPVPTLGGCSYGFGLVSGPLDQSIIEKRGDVLCYTTLELKEDVEVTGPLEIHVFAATSARDTDFTAKVVDVYPDGRVYNLVDGIKRVSGRKFADRPELINPGEVYEYLITMGNTSQLFRKGHRIRIEISSSNFPLFDRNMNTGNPIGKDASGIPAKQTVYHQSGYVSYIDLPVMPPSKSLQ
jgi:putative CocE/NonD family hydrolase